VPVKNFRLALRQFIFLKKSPFFLGISNIGTAHHQLKRWGATLQIESKINQGSKVTLLFPRVT
jgi:hypothetical protein